MPTRDVAESFWIDYDRLTDAQRRRFLRVLARFVEDVDSGTFRVSLRVKPVRGHPGIWEMTWEGSDGRATFSYGPEKTPGKRHVIWRRVGGHEIFQEP
jgi:hypothetical protein